MSHLTWSRTPALWLALATVWDLHTGQSSNAWLELNALTKLAGRNSAEPLMISELVRVACAQIAAGATWEAWQSPELREPELAELQAGWEALDLWHQAEGALAMERAMREKLFDDARQSDALDPNAPKPPGGGNAALAELSEMGKQLIQDPNAAVQEVILRYPRYWAWKYWHSYDEELASMQFVQAGIEAARAAAQSHCPGPALKKFQSATDRIAAGHRGFLNRFGMAMTAEDVQRFLARIGYVELQRSVLVTALALKRYRLWHGGYPADLNALAPEFLREVPRDPMDGNPLRYRPLPDGTFLLYSVGTDGEDNGGDPSPPKAGDVVYGSITAKQWWRGRDAVWPWRATPEQIKADYEAMERKRKSREEYPASTSAAELSFRKRYGLPTPGGSQTKGVTNAVK